MSSLYNSCLTCKKDVCYGCPIYETAPYTALLAIEEDDLQLGKEGGKVKSDGGSSSYYTFFRDDGYAMETEEVVRCMVDNDFDLGNVIKACRRISEDNLGRGKKGSDALYDWNKIKYTAQKQINLIEGRNEERNK